MPYTVIVLQALAIQLVIGFAAALVTGHMGNPVMYWRRKILRALWALTGWLLLAAIAWDTYQWVAHR